MSVSMDDVRKALEPEEPDYAAASRLGSGSLPHLRELVDGGDPMMASKAAYAASLLDGDTGQDVIVTAARSDDAALRVAAASAAANLPTDTAAGLLTDLAADTDPGVRKVALSSVPADAPEEVANRIREAAGPQLDTMPPGAGPEAAAGPAVLPMPGEDPGAGNMPGEGAAGLMPGEEPGGTSMRDASGPAPGKMPGEA